MEVVGIFQGALKAPLKSTCIQPSQNLVILAIVCGGHHWGGWMLLAAAVTHITMIQLFSTISLLRGSVQFFAACSWCLSTVLLSMFCMSIVLRSML